MEPSTQPPSDTDPVVQKISGMTMHTIYCAGYQHPAGFVVQALADDGNGLAQHLCSSPIFARHDIGMDGSTLKHEHYDKHFGAGNWQLEWVDDPVNHSGWQAALGLNRRINPETSD
jgi:hypothetical protein